MVSGQEKDGLDVDVFLREVTLALRLRSGLGAVSVLTVVITITIPPFYPLVILEVVVLLIVRAMDVDLVRRIGSDAGLKAAAAPPILVVESNVPSPSYLHLLIVGWYRYRGWFCIRVHVHVGSWGPQYYSQRH
jgi:hypothetical protein